MYGSRIMKPIKIVVKGGEIRKSNRGEFDQSALYEYMDMDTSQ
jgi:hypothetical protein